MDRDGPFTRLDRGPKVVVDTSGDRVRTKQSFAGEADINQIMARFHKTGMLVDPSVVDNRVAIFGDFTEVGDFHSALGKVIRGRKAFDGLSSKLRTRFNNDPGELLDFMSLEANRLEAQELGIIPKDPAGPVVPAEPVTVAPVVPPVVPTG